MALGVDGPGTLRRAVKRILAKQEGQRFNSLEVAEIISKRFLGIPFMSVTAHSRHIQEAICLVPAKDFVKTNSSAIAPRARLNGREEKRHSEMTVEQYSAQVFGS
jgi:hypothetical protein